MAYIATLEVYPRLYGKDSGAQKGRPPETVFQGDGSLSFSGAYAIVWSFSLVTSQAISRPERYRSISSQT